MCVMHVSHCARVGISPVYVGFAEDGFQAVVELEEGHVLGGRTGIRVAAALAPPSACLPGGGGPRALCAGPMV